MSNITDRGADFHAKCVGQICATRIVSTAFFKKQNIKLFYRTAVYNFYTWIFSIISQKV